MGGAAVLALAVVAALRRRVRATAPGRRFFRHPTAVPGLFVLTFFVTIAFAAPVVAPYPPYYQIDIEHPNHPPSAQFLLGTDPLSRDVWSRVVYGARVSLGIGAVAMLVAATVGTAVGAVAGYFRRWVDTTLMRLVDVGLAMPRIFVLLMAVALWEHIALWVLVLLIGLTGWFGTSRLVRAEVLSLREREFVAAARALGAGAGRVIFRHVLPNAAAPIIVSAALGIGHMMLLEAGLSFLGMGVPSPTPSWQHDRRRMAQDGRRLVVGDVSRTGDLARGDGAERGGRRAARRARSPQGGGVTEPLLRVRDLKTYFVTEQGSGTARAVDGVSFEVQPGETLGIVGESGCGKTVTSLSILRLIPEPPGHIRPGSFIEFEGRNLLTLEPRDLRAIRGNQIAMIFQEPMTSLNPVFTVGDQIAEAAIVHQRLSRRAARTRAIEMLRLVGIPDPEERVDHYPHQMSGGMRQRVMIAMALVCHPKLLIADEPTTALDVTIQAQILELLDRLQAELGMAVMLITHDLGVVAGSADRVVVMYAGQVVEQAPTAALFARPLHPYTEGLLASVPRLDAPPAREHGRLHGIPGQVPAATAWPEGCRFHPRCPYAWDRCRAEAPPLLDAGGGAEPGTHTVRCWLLTDPRRRTPHP